MPTVIYFHCEAGMDRTGEIAGINFLLFSLNFDIIYIHIINK